MPIAHKPNTGGGGGGGSFFATPPFLANQLIPVGSLVSVTHSGGNTEIELSQPSTNGDRVLGFAVAEIPIGSSGKFIVNRGSLVTPVIQGGIAFVPNDPVFVATNGEVTQTPMTTTGFAMQIGFATSTTEMILTTDFRVSLP